MKSSLAEPDDGRRDAASVVARPQNLQPSAFSVRQLTASVKVERVLSVPPEAPTTVARAASVAAAIEAGGEHKMEVPNDAPPAPADVATPGTERVARASAARAGSAFELCLGTPGACATAAWDEALGDGEARATPLGSPGLTPPLASVYDHRPSSTDATRGSAAAGSSTSVAALKLSFEERVNLRAYQMERAEARRKLVLRQEEELRRLTREAEEAARRRTVAVKERLATEARLRTTLGLVETEAPPLGKAAEEDTHAAVERSGVAAREADAFSVTATDLLAADGLEVGATDADLHDLRARVAAARKQLDAEFLPSASCALQRARERLAELAAALREEELKGNALAGAAWDAPATLEALGTAALQSARRAAALCRQRAEGEAAVAAAAAEVDKAREVFRALCAELDERTPPASAPRTGPPGTRSITLRPLSADEEDEVEEALMGGGDPSEVLAEYENVPVRRRLPHACGPERSPHARLSPC